MIRILFLVQLCVFMVIFQCKGDPSLKERFEKLETQSLPIKVDSGLVESYFDNDKSGPLESYELLEDKEREWLNGVDKIQRKCPYENKPMFYVHIYKKVKLSNAFNSLILLLKIEDEECAIDAKIYKFMLVNFDESFNLINHEIIGGKQMAGLETIFITGEIDRDLKLSVETSSKGYSRDKGREVIDIKIFNYQIINNGEIKKH